MKKIISSILLFFMLLPMTNIVFLSACDNTKNDILCLSKVDVISVQYELCKQAKNIVLNFSDIIVSDLQILSSLNHKIKSFFNTDTLYITKSVTPINSNIKKYKINIAKFYKNIMYETKLSVFFVGFVFIFLIRYLGLLRLFNNPLNIKLYLNKSIEWIFPFYAFFMGRNI